MKLSEVKTILTEGQVPIHYFMILNDVVNNGGISNTVQTVLMASLIQFFKYETVSNIRYLNEHPPMADLISYVKQLPKEDQARLAEWLLSNLKGPDLPTCFQRPSLPLDQWMGWVLNANDE